MTSEEMSARLIALRDHLEALVNAAVSTRTIVLDQGWSRKLGHNPSWVKAADLEGLITALRQRELRQNRFDCVACGYGIAVDEDGCCRTCGAAAIAVFGGITALRQDPQVYVADDPTAVSVGNSFAAAEKSHDSLCTAAAAPAPQDPPREMPCPNCGCTYAVARDLRAWKDYPDYDELVEELAALKEKLSGVAGASGIPPPSPEKVENKRGAFECATCGKSLMNTVFVLGPDFQCPVCAGIHLPEEKE